jgi:hypothetical protein
MTDTLTITLHEAERLGPEQIRQKYEKEVFSARESRKKVIMQYADYFPVEELYPLSFRKVVDGKYVYFEQVSSR